MGNAFVYEVSFGEKILSVAMRDKEGTIAFRFEKPPGFDFKPRTIKSERLNRNSAFTGSG